MNNSYVYTYTNTSTGKIIYIGMGTNTSGSYARALDLASHAACRELNLDEITIRIVSENLTKANAHIIERVLIAECSRHFTLRNIITPNRNEADSFEITRSGIIKSRSSKLGKDTFYAALETFNEGDRTKDFVISYCAAVANWAPLGLDKEECIKDHNENKLENYYINNGYLYESALPYFIGYDRYSRDEKARLYLDWFHPPSYSLPAVKALSALSLPLFRAYMCSYFCEAHKLKGPRSSKFRIWISSPSPTIDGYNFKPSHNFVSKYSDWYWFDMLYKFIREPETDSPLPEHVSK